MILPRLTEGIPMNIQRPTPMTPLRARMITDMSGRNLGPASQTSHLRACRRFAAWLGRSPETAMPDDVKYFQQHLIESGASIGTRNQTMTPSLKARVMLSLAYGCGMRAGEVVRLKVGDIVTEARLRHDDSDREIIRIVQSKGRKDRNVMLPVDILRCDLKMTLAGWPGCAHPATLLPFRSVSSALRVAQVFLRAIQALHFPPNPRGSGPAVPAWGIGLPSPDVRCVAVSTRPTP
jgi:hypothetical protein